MISFVKLTDIGEEGLRGSYFITGFQGFGLVGYLSTRHIVRELKLKKVGFIKTRYMPSFTLYDPKYGIQYPFEIYAGSGLVVLLNNALPHEREGADFAEYIAKLAKNIGAKEVILIGGLDQSLRESEDEQYRWIPINSPDIKLEGKILEERHIVGPLALTMMFMGAQGLKGVAILAYTEPLRPDPRASAVVVKLIERIIGAEIDTQKLLEEASLIEAIEQERKKIEEAIEEGERGRRLSYI